MITRVRYINGPAGAACTRILKKEVRQMWEARHPGSHTYVWGYDVTEQHRAERVMDSLPLYEHTFPLIERGLTKADVHGMATQMGLKRLAMYEMGYPNNNCVGCVKGGKGYWNQIRRDFPDVFVRMAALERQIGHSCIRGVFLDELPPDAGNLQREIMDDCSILCQVALKEVT